MANENTNAEPNTNTEALDSGTMRYVSVKVNSERGKPESGQEVLLPVPGSVSLESIAETWSDVPGLASPETVKGWFGEEYPELLETRYNVEKQQSLCEFLGELSLSDVAKTLYRGLRIDINAKLRDEKESDRKKQKPGSVPTSKLGKLKRRLK